MARTSAAVSFDHGSSLPRLADSGCLWIKCRPLDAASRIFADLVPRKRCLGFTQGGLSQWWQTSSPSGIESVSWESIQDTRCDLSDERAPTPMRPYPRVVLQAVHGQHSSGPAD